jgi:two-component system, chemotaxis family, response regulator WspR
MLDTDNSKSFDWKLDGSPDEYPIMVLLVDDQLMVAEAIRRMLAGQGNIDFHYCANPAEAIKVARDVRPTVILQDIVMPGVDGLDLVRRYRTESSTSGIPIIVLSSKEEATVKNEAFEAGANDYLVKLPDKIELIARIRYHSKAYLNQLQRDDAYRALRESQRQLQETNFQLEKLSNLDGLTGLINRRYFDQQVEMEWKRAIRAQKSLSIFMIDVDNFKGYNDSRGHLAGDSMLKGVAETIQRHCLRPTDCAARFGGEEFAIMLADATVAESQCFGEKLRRAIQDECLSHGASSVSPYLTVSIGGAAAVPDRGEFSSLLIEAADQALYKAKSAGKNRVVLAERREHNWLQTDILNVVV